MPYNTFIHKELMFNFFSHQTESNSVPDPDPLFATEKELILYVIKEATIILFLNGKHSILRGEDMFFCMMFGKKIEQ